MMGKKIKVLRIDNAVKYTSIDFMISKMKKGSRGS